MRVVAVIETSGKELDRSKHLLIEKVTGFEVVLQTGFRGLSIQPTDKLILYEKRNI